MIARTWRCLADARRAAAAARYLQQTGVAEVQAIVGYEGHLLTGRDCSQGQVEFTLVTFWKDAAAVERFAGDDHAIARRYPDDDEYLLTSDDHVTHADVIDARGPLV